MAYVPENVEEIYTGLKWSDFPEVRFSKRINRYKTPGADTITKERLNYTSLPKRNEESEFEEILQGKTPPLIVRRFIF